jgi:hypothetical protein
MFEPRLFACRLAVGEAQAECGTLAALAGGTPITATFVGALASGGHTSHGAIAYATVINVIVNTWVDGLAQRASQCAPTAN